MGEPKFKLHLAGWPGCGEVLGALTIRRYQKHDRTRNATKDVSKVTCARCLLRMAKESQKMTEAAAEQGVWA